MEGDAEVGVPLDALVDGLSEPAAFGLHDDVPVDVVQTHASVVFLAGEFAWKVKKPVRFWDLLDYGTVAARAHWCAEEVRLNRRLAPELYVGVDPIVRRDGALEVGGDGLEGTVVDHAVKMRRFDESRSLAARLAREGGTDLDLIDGVARMIAAFHRANRLEHEDALDVVDAFETVLQKNFDGTPLEDNAVFPLAPHAALRERLLEQLALHRPQLEARSAAGRIVDGHGDIRLDHVLELDDGWVIVDCVEFSTVLRHIDPVSDLAFLSMDLVASGYPVLAAELETAYAAAADEHDMAPLLPLFRGYRAYVRATVDYHASLEPELAARATAQADGARAHLALAWTESRAGARPPIVVLRGPSGSGKSYLSRAIAPLLRAEVVRSDVVRKALLDMAPTDRPDAEDVEVVYGREMSIRTYAALLDRARAGVEDGHAVLLDATYLLRAPRDEARLLASELGVPFAIIDLDCPREVIEERIAARGARGDDASDADVAVYLQQLREAEPLGPEEQVHVVPFDATSSPMPLLMDLITCLVAQP